MTWRRALQALVFSCALLTSALGRLHAQTEEPALSNAEVEKLRDTAYEPPNRVLAFITFLDDRIKAIDKLTVGKRQPGREEDLHDKIEEFTSIANDLVDNLDDYGRRHRDIRKALPKLVAAIERWGTALKSPPDDAAYSVSRKLALEALNDLREVSTAMIEEQKAWFKDHPPAKDPGGRPQP